MTGHKPTPQWSIAKPWHCKWGRRKDQGPSLSVLAGCCIASPARRKSISLLYCQSSYTSKTEFVYELWKWRES